MTRPRKPWGPKQILIQKQTTITKTDVNTNADINTIDGVRISIGNSWALMRASNTSSKLGFRFEGDTEDNLKQIKDLFESNFLRIFPDIQLDYD